MYTDDNKKEFSMYMLTVPLHNSSSSLPLPTGSMLPGSLVPPSPGVCVGCRGWGGSGS